MIPYLPLFERDYRPFSLPWIKKYINPRTYILTVKYFYQRGTRGYADCDYWDLNTYMEDVLLGVIKDLKLHHHGFPATLTEQSWEAVLDEIIIGLEASKTLRDIPDEFFTKEEATFEKILTGKFAGLYKMMYPDGVIPFDTEAYAIWKIPLEKQQKRAQHLLIKHWKNLLD